MVLNDNLNVTKAYIYQSKIGPKRSAHLLPHKQGYNMEPCTQLACVIPWLLSQMDSDKLPKLI